MEGEEGDFFLTLLGGDMTVGTVAPANVFLGLKKAEAAEGESLAALGVRGLGSWGLTSCLAGGLMVGMSTSVNTLLSRLCSDREGLRAWLGVGVVGVQKLFLLAYSEEVGVGYDLNTRQL